MKTMILYVLSAGVLLVWCGCASETHQDTPPPPSQTKTSNLLTNRTGTMQQMGVDFVFLPDGAPSQRYLLKNLPSDFQQDGLRVRISGEIGEIPPNVRLIGTPLTIRQIERLSE